ncbi:MAG: methanogenesis marker 16 metalloprotein, partial [Promethearchaeota archaeon]
MKNRSIADIRTKLESGTAVIKTAQEILDIIAQEGETINFEDIDVVTTATKGIMSGTSAVLGFRIADPKQFTKVKTISLNGIEAYPGPAPNEFLGVVDLTVYGTQKSHDNPKYGGGHLFRDLVEGRSIQVVADSIEGVHIETEVTLHDDMSFAQMLGTRHAFRNYNAFLNPGTTPVKSIFSVMGLAPNFEEISFCGVGSLNPLENDPKFETLGIGSPILVNGAQGYVLGTGTRSSVDRPNLMTVASMFDMIPEFMGGFQTSNGPEVICSVAAPIPILNERILQQICIPDKNIPLNFVDIVGRSKIGETTYGDAWKGDWAIGFRKGLCESCELNQACPIEENCPTDCFAIGSGIDKSKCFNCGTCTFLCPHHAFTGKLGAIEFNSQQIPITLRQSDRVGAIKLMKNLKRRIENLKFPIVSPVSPIQS